MSAVQQIIDKLLQLVANTSQEVLNLEAAVVSDNKTKDDVIKDAVVILKSTAAALESATASAVGSVSVTTAHSGH